MTRSVFSSGRSSADSLEPARDHLFTAFRTVLSAYIVGNTQLEAVRHELINCVAASHDRAVSMLHYLRAANESGLVPDAAMHVLVTDIQAAVDAGDHDEQVKSRADAGIRDHSQTYARTNRTAARRRRLLAGRFEVLARVGQGGIGDVYLARDLRRMEAGLNDPRVAIKIIQRRHSDCPDAIRSLQREAVNAQCLVHQGIRRVFELDRDRHRFFIVMEWLDGETLAARLDRTKGQPMAADAFRSILLQTTSALSFAHRHGIVHGDIKPGNIFMTAHGDIKLLDFGHTEGIVPPSGLQPFAITRGYSSIEVSQGAQPEICDDVYSLSIMLYRMLVGRRPFGHHNSVEAEALGLKPRQPAMLNVHQWQVLQAGLALRREYRLATVAELRAGLLFSPVVPIDRTSS